jgi:hypothetical protein
MGTSYVDGTIFDISTTTVAGGYRLSLCRFGAGVSSGERVQADWLLPAG